MASIGEQLFEGTKALIAFRLKRDVTPQIEKLEARVKALAERVQAFEEMADRVKALEERPSVRYRGVWSQGELYTAGDMVTRHGSVWYCKGSTSEAPRNDSANANWVLAVKHGRDGRDADER